MEFFKYLESDGSEFNGVSAWPVFGEGLRSTLNFLWMRHRGPCIIALMIFVKIPFSLYYEKNVCELALWLRKLNNVQAAMLHTKFLKVSPATNKTVSNGMLINLKNEATNCQWGFFWMGAE